MVLLFALAAPARADGPTTGRKKRVAGVLTTLAGAVMVIAAAGLGNQSTQDNDSTNTLFQSGGVWNSTSRSIDAEGRRDDIAQKVLYPLGGVAMVAGLAVAIVGWWHDKHHPAPMAAPAKGGPTTSWSVSF